MIVILSTALSRFLISCPFRKTVVSQVDPCSFVTKVTVLPKGEQPGIHHSQCSVARVDWLFIPHLVMCSICSGKLRNLSKPFAQCDFLKKYVVARTSAAAASCLCYTAAVTGNIRSLPSWRGTDRRFLQNLLLSPRDAKPDYLLSAGRHMSQSVVVS